MINLSLRIVDGKPFDAQQRLNRVIDLVKQKYQSDFPPDYKLKKSHFKLVPIDDMVIEFRDLPMNATAENNFLKNVHLGLYDLKELDSILMLKCYFDLSKLMRG